MPNVYLANAILVREEFKGVFTLSASSLITCWTQSSTGTSPDFKQISGLDGGSYAESIPVKPKIETGQTG